MIVLDASAVLALLFREPGHERVRDAFPGAVLGTVNFLEVLTKFIRDGIDVRPAIARIRASRLEIVPFTQSQALTAAELVPLTRAVGLSLGDRACLALAMERGLDVLTTDRAWGSLALPVRIELVR